MVILVNVIVDLYVWIHGLQHGSLRAQFRCDDFVIFCDEFVDEDVGLVAEGWRLGGLLEVWILLEVKGVVFLDFKRVILNLVFLRPI